MGELASAVLVKPRHDGHRRPWDRNGSRQSIQLFTSRQVVPDLEPAAPSGNKKEASQMRWFTIRSAKVDSELRKTFERYGTVGMQISLGDMNHFVHQGRPMKADAVLESVLAWLTEQYDKADLKETWLITMEIAITLFVGGELFVETWNLFHH
jgi:hypothetical protein